MDELDQDVRFDHAEWASRNYQRCDTCPFKWDWMKFVGFSEDRTTLANARMLWLAFQSLLPNAGQHPAPAMPDDPEPGWWHISKPEPEHNGFGLSLFERVKAAVAVEDIAERVTNLRGQGNVLSGACPLHDGSGSEFVIWRDIQYWKCYGRCQVGGDVIHLVKELMERGIEWKK
jgi:hypothetical protein